MQSWDILLEIILLLLGCLLAASVAPRAAAGLNRRRGLTQTQDVQESAEHPACEFLIIGFGPAGRGAVQFLDDVRDRVVVMDLSPVGIASAEELGVSDGAG